MSEPFRPRWMFEKAGSKVKPTDFLRALQELWMVRGQRSHWARALITDSPTPSPTP